MKLWDKGYQLDLLVEKFMTGDDPTLDHALIPYDCLGSMAHAKMLEKIGILTIEECQQIMKGLQEITELAKRGDFGIQFEEEDVHTAIENYLTRTCGEAGKKLHTARSRNDQVLLDLRLYLRDQLLKIGRETINVCHAFHRFAASYDEVPIPGRTHFQRAMPSSLGLWAGAFLESFLDDLYLLQGAYELIDQCPLGSAASYGVSLPIDRQFCADFLGFRSVQNNVLYANNSRGKFEALVLHALVQIMNDLSKMASDIIIFAAPEFGYLVLPEKFCPGSSLMPQKRNPCPFELIRAKSASVQGFLFQILEIIRILPSGYNRDFQETKRPLMQGLMTTEESLRVFARLFSELKVNKQSCIGAFTPELFATDKVLQLAVEGIPFREAYRRVAKESESMVSSDPVANILSKTHLGATGNLGLQMSEDKLLELKKWINEEIEKQDKIFSAIA